MSCLITSKATAQIAEFLWVKEVVGGSLGHMTTDASGNILMTSTLGTGIVVAKYNADGDSLWVKQITGTSSDYVYLNQFMHSGNITTDFDHNVYIIGGFGNPNWWNTYTVTLDDTTLTNLGYQAFFVAKYDSNGNLLWARKAEESGSNTGSNGFGITTDALGSVFITGRLGVFATFDTTTVTSNGNDDIFIAKYDTDGNFIWVKQAGGPKLGLSGDPWELGTRIVMDADGDLIIVGYANAGAIFDADTLAESGEFIAKYDTDGNMIWVKNTRNYTPPPGADYCITTDVSGNIFVTGEIPHIYFWKTYLLVMKYDTDGNLIWEKVLGEEFTEVGGKSITTDSFGNLVIAGLFSGTITFENGQLEPYGGRDILILKYDTDGNLLWAEHAGSRNDWEVGDIGYGVAIDSSDNIFVTGYVEDSPGYFGSLQIGGPVVFLTKIKDKAVDFSADPTAGVAPLAVQFTGVAAGIPTSWAWDFDNDGTIDSRDQNPAWIFARGGNFTVSLTVTIKGDQYTVTRENYVSVVGPINIFFNKNLTADAGTENYIIDVMTTGILAADNVTDFQFQLSYSPGILEVDLPDSGLTFNNSEVLDSTWSITSSEVQSGVLSISASGSTPITIPEGDSEAKLLAIPFNVIGEGNSYLDFSENELNTEDRNVNWRDGSFSNSFIEFGGLTVYADHITGGTYRTTSGSTYLENTYTASGNVNINNILKFDGDLLLDLDNLTIEGNSLISIDNIPEIGKVDLYDGSFKFSAEQEAKKLLGIGLGKLNNVFKIADLPVEITNFELLKDGIRIDGMLVLPEVMGFSRVEVRTLQLTERYGIDLIGKVSVSKVKIGDTIQLKELELVFDTINDNFTGSGKLETSVFGIDASTQIIGGELDAIEVWVKIGDPIPLGTIGLSLSGGGGSVSGLAKPPLSLQLGVSLVPSVQGSFDIVEFDKVTLGYTFGRKLTGSGDLKVFGISLADVSLVALPSSLGFGYDFNLIDVLIGHTDATISAKSLTDINFEGNMWAKLQVPDKDGFPFDLIDSFYDLPFTVAQTNAHVRNTSLKGNVSITSIFDLSYALKWRNGSMDASFSTDFSLWNFDLFNSAYLASDLQKKSLNRFEGSSLIVSKNKVNRLMKMRNGVMQQQFTISTITPTLIVRVSNETSVPEYSITTPDSTIITSENVSEYSNIQYVENTKENKSFYLFKNPQLGDWSLNIPGEGTHSIDIFGANTRPSIALENIEKTDGTVNLSWKDSDPDDNAQINLYYDMDNNGTDGVLIVENISEDDLNNQYAWNYGDLSSGEYYLYATIDDKVNSTVISYARDPLTLTALDAPSPPDNLSYQLSDTSISLSWDKTNTTDVNYVVYYSTTDKVDYNSSYFNVGDTSSFEFTNLTPGKTYKIAVVAADSLFRESDFSKTVEFEYVSTTQNNAPSITQQEFPMVTFVNTPYSYQVLASDPDGDDLDFSLKDKPDGMSIDNNGDISWTPTDVQLGNHLVSIKVADSQDLVDSSFFRVNVLDSVSSKGYVSFSKPIYISYDDVGAINLTDINLNLSPSNIDSQLIKIYSKSHTDGIELVGYETQANSGKFSASFGFSNAVSSNSVLQVAEEDTIWVEYIDSFPADTVIDISYFTLLPVISLMPHSIEFDTVSVGDSLSQTITLTNVGGSNLMIDSTEVTGPDEVEFLIVSGGEPTTLVPSDSLDITVGFFPQNEGTKEAFLVITSNALSSPDTLTLTGGGTMSIWEETLPLTYNLSQNYPNPFNPVTTLRYSLPEREEVVLKIYDILGRQIRTLVQGVEEPGYKLVTWDGSDEFGRPVGTGVYLYQIRAGDFTQTRKMLLLK